MFLGSVFSIFFLFFFNFHFLICSNNNIDCCNKDFIESFIKHYEFNAEGRYTHEYHPYLLSKTSYSLDDLENRLQRKIRKTAVQIKAEIHSRLSFGIGCVPLIMIGIGLGIIKKGGHLLSAFGASSIPAAVLIVCIISGKNIIENLGSQPQTGMILLWAGPAMLVLLAAVIYRGLLKN